MQTGCLIGDFSLVSIAASVSLRIEADGNQTIAKVIERKALPGQLKGHWL